MNASRNCDVRSMEVAHQVEDRIGLHPGRRRRRSRSARVVRSEVPSFADARPGRVDERQVGQLAATASRPRSARSTRSARPPRSISQRAVLAAERRGRAEPAGRSVGRRRGSPSAWRYQVTIRGALTGVGRGQALADQGVEEGRLAGLHPAGDRDPQRLVERRMRGLDDALAWSVPSADRSASSAMRRTSAARSPGPSAVAHPTR